MSSADPRDPDEAARIRAALDQGRMGLSEPEVESAIEEWEIETAALAATLLEHLPEEAVPGLMGGLFAIFMHAYDENVEDYLNAVEDMEEEEEDYGT